MNALSSLTDDVQVTVWKRDMQREKVARFTNNEVKSVISQLDSSVRQLAGYEPIHVTSGAVRETDRHGDGQASQESNAGDTVDSANAEDSAMDDLSDSGSPR